MLILYPKPIDFTNEVCLQSGRWVGLSKCLCYMLNWCTLLVKVAYKVGGWVVKILMLYAKPVQFTNKVCLQGGWVGREMVQNMLT